jgi:AGCS family alanine or glycine:cation symporter
MLMQFMFEFDWLGSVFIFILIASLVITCFSRGIQLRAIPLMVNLLLKRQQPSSFRNDLQAIDPRKALLTAMSTTIGIGNIFGPMVAIAFAGPGALIAYLLATLLGAASTYTEVYLALKYRHRLQDQSIEAGPMSYIRIAFHPFFSFLYALFCFALLSGWSMSQSHTIAHLAIDYGVPYWLTGIFLAVVVMYAIHNGIGWIADLNSRLVPLMFVLYISSSSYIISCHLDQLPIVTRAIFSSFWSPQSIIAGVGVFTFFDVLRWGLARALQSNEAGLGTSTIPHSLSQNVHPKYQAALAMASVYSNGLICLLSGLVFMVSGHYEKATAPFTASVISDIYKDHFDSFGPPLILTITFLFGLGTILGNSFNGTQCFAYLSKHRAQSVSIILAGFSITLGSALDLKFVWGSIDYLMAPVALIHTTALLWFCYYEKGLYNLD